jgi:hypothetical protein
MAIHRGLARCTSVTRILGAGKAVTVQLLLSCPPPHSHATTTAWHAPLPLQLYGADERTAGVVPVGFSTARSTQAAASWPGQVGLSPGQMIQMVSGSRHVSITAHGVGSIHRKQRAAADCPIF